MATIFDLVTIDSPSPDHLARFWSAVLSLEEVEREGGDRWIVLADKDRRRRIGIQRGEHRAGGLHLDLACSRIDFDDETARLIGLGATIERRPRTEPYGRIANLADPDGNPFDLCAYLD